MRLSMDIGSLLAAYAAGLDPAQVLSGIYEQIAETGERPVWLSLVAHEDALAALRMAQGRVQVGEILPLFGIPFAVKDNIDFAGLPTTAACPDFSFLPQRSATVVEKLVAAGAILIGKTNLDQFATGLNGTRSPYGIPSCVFDARYISGGSSSGSAVTVAAGLVSFSLGTDTAGSGRVPAAFNNIVGLKPTKGLLSTRGLVPACRSLDCISVFANTVADALAVTQIAAGFDAEDDFSRRAPADSLTPTSLPASFRFGVPDAAGLEFCDDDSAVELFAESVARCEALGGIKVEFDLTPFTDAAKLLYAGPWVAERLAAIKDFAERKAGAIHPVVRDIILGGAKQSAVDAFEAQYTLAALARRAEKAWAGMDVMLLPTTPTIYTIEAMLADPMKLNSILGTYTNFTNLMDLSAIAVPAGFRDRGTLEGLPFGIMLIGHAFEDGRIGAIADRLHRALEGATLGGSNMPLQNSLSNGINVTATAVDSVSIAVVGAHLSGQPLNYQLTERGATFLTSARTARGYRLYALTGTVPPKPALMFDGAAAGLIEVEVWEIPVHSFGSFVRECPSPLGIGTIRLEDGSNVRGFICEAHALKTARDITNFGSWRNFLNSSDPAAICKRLPQLLQSLRKTIVVALEFRR